MAEDKFLLKVVVDWRRLHAHSFQASFFKDGQFSSPIGSPTDAVECNFAFVNFRPAVDVVDYASKHAVGGGTGFYRSLTRAGTVHGKEPDAVGQNGGETFSE